MGPDRVGQNLEVAGHRRLRQPHGLVQITGAGLTSGTDERQKPQARGSATAFKGARRPSASLRLNGDVSPSAQQSVRTGSVVSAIIDLPID